MGVGLIGIFLLDSLPNEWQRDLRPLPGAGNGRRVEPLRSEWDRSLGAQEASTPGIESPGGAIDK
eukprot:766577-Hanusia_phi.AAC.6